MPKNRISLENAKSLHSSLKEWYSLPGDRFEARIDEYIVDIKRDDLLIEIQTRNLSAVRQKLRSLVKCHNVRLVYPIPQKKWIVHVGTQNNEILSRRKSPKKGKLTDLFDELMRIPDLFDKENFTLEVVLIEEEEIRCNDGKGSWRRRGTSIKERKLVNVNERAVFKNKADFLRFLPEDLSQPFTNKSLAKSLSVSVRQSRRITYSLRKMQVIAEVGKNGRELLFVVAI